MAQLVSGTTYGGQTAWHAGNYGRVISRGNPGAGSPLALLNIGDTHYYFGGSTSAVQISTEMAENSVYELSYYTTFGGNNNQDFVLNPNYTTYGNQFRHFYWGSPTVYVFDQTLSTIYFDHYAGGVGTGPNGLLTIHNYRDGKTYTYRGSDTGSVCLGTGSWTNQSQQWQFVGTMVLSGFVNANWKIFVRRIG